ncbi:uncharacterized protein LOC128234390 [Mya arenaria]|uniref:uncharacterized protein LOC128234390 n=1 Tax=Mya arenaria TaxID=6604 RepID=UPI0022E2772A|nr:uncharacterized protein LOC128234390 [Mya arenaria]XP_052804563.1 uncharacterized protein LOC128234390 [Mya arenaria]XP_052804564.1 uncharacterized protein LOC128234390 [Mya arenaria]
MSKLIDTNKPESRNWLKQWRAVYVTRHALLPIVSEEAAQLHGDILNKAQVPACIKCSSRDVQNRNARCPYHVVLRDELVDEHAYGQARGIGALTLKNTKAENWVNSPWEIAKVFMPPAGYEDKTTIEETDFNGIAAFIINCKHFHGKITGTICEKAREVVNHIRHMPDICSTALTERATTDCIDNLYALLNEQGLKTRPEAILARTQLDELKTSKDENVYYSICQKLHDEFEQKLADIERKFNADEIDKERAKESMHSEAQQFQKNQENMLRSLERISDDAKQDLLGTKDDILLSIEEEKRRVMELMERTITERIGKYVTDGKLALEIHAENLKRQTTEHIEHSLTKRKIEVEDQTEIHAKRLRTEKLQKQKRELKTQLIEHYNKSASKIPVRLDIDETIENIYENPELTLIKIENGKTTKKDIPEVSQLFSTSDGPMAKTIIVEGEPGRGKTSLCKKIVHDWRKLKENVEQEPITSSLSKFEFVFYIILRLVKTESEVKAMIVEHILKKIDSDYESAHSLLGEILKSEHCLLLFDGLDEWRGKMPHIETSWLNCTTLITTRPYKLAELKVIPTQMGKHVKLDGVKNPEELVLKVIRKLEEYHKTNKQPKSCIKDLKDKQLWHFRENPVILVNIVWLWQKSKLRENMSRSTLYQEIIDERWYEMCDKKQQDQDPHELYDVLSEIAFNKLLSENEDESLVFNIKGKHLEKFKQYKDASLESGVLSCSNVPGERFPQYQFLHKTFQEYLAAVFLSKCGSTISTSCNLVKEIYLNHRNESVFALKEVFLFLCGLNPDAAAEFSKTLNELFTENCEEQGSAWIAEHFQQMIMSGYDDAERNGKFGADFCLQHIVLNNEDYTGNHRSKLKLCMDDKRKSNLKSLRIVGKSDIASALQYMDDPSVLDLDVCKNLKFVALKGVSYKDINLLNLNGLVECEIEFNDYNPASKLISSVQSSDLQGLKRLVLINVGLECETMDIFSKLKCVKDLDLTWSKSIRAHDKPFDFGNLRHLKYLNKLGFREFPFSDVVNIQMFNPCSLTVEFRTQQRAPQLMAALVSKADGYPAKVLDGSHFPQKYVGLKNVRMSAGKCMRLFNLMLQSGHGVRITLTECTIEGDIRPLPERLGGQTAVQGVAPQLASMLYGIYIRFEKMTVSADVFMRLVLVKLQSEHGASFTLTECTIEGDIRQLPERVGGQTAVQGVAPQLASMSNITYIYLEKMTVSADVFMRLVLVKLQPEHDAFFTLIECTIEGDIRQLPERVGGKTAVQGVAPQLASMSNRIYIRFEKMTVPADVFMRLVLVKLQSEHGASFTLTECTIEGDIRQLPERVGGQTAVQGVAPQLALMLNITDIRFEKMTVSADVFMRLVLVMLQLGHDASFTLIECTIEGDIRQLQERVGDQTAVQGVAPQLALHAYTTNRSISLKNVIVPAEVLRGLVSVMLQSVRRRVDCELQNCAIEPVEEVRKLQVEMWHQPAIHVDWFSMREQGWCIKYSKNKVINQRREITFQYEYSFHMEDLTMFSSTGISEQ